MIKEINKMQHYEIPGGDKRYYINANGDIYSMRTQDYLRREGNQIILTLNGVRKKYNSKTLLIETLLACVDKLNEDNNKLCSMLMHYYK